MSVRTVITCNECGAEKKEVNHWFVANILTMNKNFRVAPFDTIQYKEWDQHFCGQTCVSKAFQRWMDAA